MTIRAVFFDMGGTIETFSYTRALGLAATPGLQEMLHSAGIHLPLDPQQLYPFVSDGLARYHQWSVHSMQELPPQQVWRDYILCGLPVDPDILDSIAEDLMVYVETRYYCREIRPEVPEVLSALQRMGLKIGLISNVCSRGQVLQNLAEYGIRQYFNPIVLSSEYGRRKPDPAIFHYAARLANVPTSECLYVGDRIARDILGARRAGFGLAIQIKHGFSNGEPDEGATPDAVIENMSGLLDILREKKLEIAGNNPAIPAHTQRVRALLFDAGDILYYRPERGCKFAAFLEELGLDDCDRHPAEREDLMQQAYLGQISQDQYREAVLRLYGVLQADQIERGKQILAEEDEAIRFFEGVQQTLFDLKQKGFLLGIVTDTANPIHVKLSWFEQGGFEHVWDSIISSQEIGVRKPDPGIYHAAMQQLGVTCDQAVFVGHKASELDGARAVGLKTIAFNFEIHARADFYIRNFPDLLELPVIAGTGETDPMTNRIEAVLFDMGGTLRKTRKRSRDERLKYTGEILKLLGSSADPEKFSRLLARRSNAYRCWARENLIELNEVKLWTDWMLPDWPESLVRRHAVRLNLLWRDATGERIIFPEAPAVLAELFRRGYRLGLVSNTTCSTESLDALRKLGLTGYFETIILSSVVGVRKPDPAILLEATCRMGIDPGKCAYIGDLPHRDVAAARKAGFSKTILVRNRRWRAAEPAEDFQLKPDQYIRNLRELLDIFPWRNPPQPSLIYAASVSSMWAEQSFESLEDFIEAGRRIGFDRIELNHQVNSTMLAGMSRGHRISSVHEPCPADISVAALKQRGWLISAIDEDCRREGVKSIQRSIDLARQLGVSAVVVHSGNVPVDRSIEDQLRILYDAGQKTSEEYRDLRDLLIKMRRDLAPPALQAVQQSLVELLEYAGPSGIRLGLENRYHYWEFPSPDELEMLLGLAGPDRLGFIYDVGHAYALSRLGFYPHDEWLKRFAPRLLGTHLHDVTGLQDHQLPGQGEVDFDRIAAYLPQSAFRTLEFQGHHTQEQVKAGLRFLERHGCIENQKKG